MSTPVMKQDTLHPQLREFIKSLGKHNAGKPESYILSSLMAHGGLQMLLSEETVRTRMKRMSKKATGQEAVGSADLVSKITMMAANFFQHLVNKQYQFTSELISFLSFPHEGRTYTEAKTIEGDNRKIPAVFTFVGQFVDHDLTMNALAVVEPQAGVVANGASPVIDLDSVYGPRTATQSGAVFNPDGSFNMRTIEGEPNGFDLTRTPDGTANIFDNRNDENQLILQIHILIARVHNKLLKTLHAATRAEVVANWQSLLINDYLPKILDKKTYDFLTAEVVKPNYGEFKYRPGADSVVRMPHEFALGFRMGHSMLRSGYHINNYGEIALFLNRNLTSQPDLRGGLPLQPEHVINWDVFLPKNGEAPPSLKIDSKVTHAVFDLPASAIPDMTSTQLGNLPQRNLIRSTELALAAGEDVASFYGIKALTPAEVEPDAASHVFFERTDNTFKTPLWYYILREAEVQAGGHHLGRLGSRLMGEVILGGIYFGADFPFQSSWKSKITGSNVVLLRDLIDFVNS